MLSKPIEDGLFISNLAIGNQQQAGWALARKTFDLFQDMIQRWQELRAARHSQFGNFQNGRILEQGRC